MSPTLLFDMDGTLVHTDPLHFAAFQTVLAPHGLELDWATYRAFIMGKSNESIAARLLPNVPADQHAVLMDRKEAEYRLLAQKLEPAAGLMELLDWAGTAGIALAVVTSAPRASADHVLEALNIRSRFKAVITRNDVEKAKPHPMPYLQALEAVGGEASRSVAFEDSSAGVSSAVAAGLPVVGLTELIDENDLRGHGASLLVEDYRDPQVMGFLRRHLRLDETATR